MKTWSKVCPKCNLDLPKSSYTKGAGKDKTSSYCKPCNSLASQERRKRLGKEAIREETRNWNKKNRKRAVKLSKRGRYKGMYGISEDEYAECMATSDRCEICSSKKLLVYDHCHDSMKFRGVLCRLCNTGLGALGDNAKGLRKALKYLEGEKNGS